jgi:hypothetical protein
LLLFLWVYGPNRGIRISSPFTVAERIAMTLAGLYRALAARSSISLLVGRGTEVLATALIILVCQRVRRVEQRILAMLVRFQAAKLRVMTGGRTRTATGTATRTRAAAASANLPRGFAWLLPLVPCEGANFASQLRHTLFEPEMIALLEASPQARRVLAPLCRMLGIEASLLRGPVVARPAKDVAVARVRKTRPPVDWGRIPLPRGVLAAARRDRLLKR